MSIQESRRVYEEAKRIHLGTLMQEVVGFLDRRGYSSDQIDVVGETFSSYEVEGILPIEADEETHMMLGELRVIFGVSRIIIDAHEARRWDITKPIHPCVEVGDEV